MNGGRHSIRACRLRTIVGNYSLPTVCRPGSSGAFFVIVRLIFRHGMVHLNHVLWQHGKRGEACLPGALERSKDINTADLQNMDKLTQVEEMFLSAPDGYDLSVFAELPNLKVLYLYYSGELDTEPVVNAKQIEQLVINGEDIYDRTVSSPEEE